MSSAINNSAYVESRKAFLESLKKDKKKSSKFVNRNNALERSNMAHTRLRRIMLERKDLVSADYHLEVELKQSRANKILTRKERKKIFEKQMEIYDVNYIK